MAARDVRFQQHSRRQSCEIPAATDRARLSDRASPARHRAPRAVAQPPRLDARRHIAPFAVGVGRASGRRRPPRSPARSPASPIPTPRRARTRARAHSRRRRRPSPNDGVGHVAPDQPDREARRDRPPRDHARVDVERCRESGRRSPRTTFGVAPTTRYSPNDCSKRHTDVDVVTSVHTAPHFLSARGSVTAGSDRISVRRPMPVVGKAQPAARQRQTVCRILVGCIVYGADAPRSDPPASKSTEC